jgi:uncharacterized protein (TIGR01777 family)
MRVVVTGATGTIGSALVRALLERGDDVVALSRDTARGRERLGAGVEVQAWPAPGQGPPPAAALAGADAVANLLGAPIAQRWSAAAKRRIRESRVNGTRNLVEALASLPEADRPRTLLSQSASGYYGPRDDRPLVEDAPAGDDWLARIVLEWEREARAAERFARVVCTRTGVVLSPRGGALAKMLPPFRLGVGGPVAGGRQYVPWVHVDDVAAAMTRCLADDSIGGAVNVVAPNPVTNKELSRALGRVLHRPAVAPVPALALRVLYGEMSTIVTTGARLVPERLRAAGHEFRFPDVEPALRDVLGRA